MELLLAALYIFVPLGLVDLVVRRARGHDYAMAATLMVFGCAGFCWGAFELFRQPALQPALRALPGSVRSARAVA